MSPFRRREIRVVANVCPPGGTEDRPRTDEISRRRVSEMLETSSPYLSLDPPRSSTPARKRRRGDGAYANRTCIPSPGPTGRRRTPSPSPGQPASSSGLGGGDLHRRVGASSHSIGPLGRGPGQLLRGAVRRTGPAAMGRSTSPGRPRGFCLRRFLEGRPGPAAIMARLQCENAPMRDGQTRPQPDQDGSSLKGGSSDFTSCASKTRRATRRST